jgi:heavy metal sensor kinase
MSFVKNNKRRFALTVGMRLTLWGTAVTSGVCLILCVGLYVGLRISLYGEVDRFLEGEVLEFRAILTEEDETLSEIEREIRRELGSRMHDDLTFRLLDAQGNLIVTSDPGDRLPRQWAPLAHGPEVENTAYLETVPLAGLDFPARVCSQWVRLPNGSSCIAQATYLLDRVHNSLSMFRRACFIALMLATVLALFGGRWLAIRSLAPVGRMTIAARSIGAGGTLSERIGRSGTSDELDLLAETLNAMLDRIEKQVRQIQQFTADAAHELRTPLSALRGGAEVALSRDRSALELRKVIEESIEHYIRLSRLTDDLLLLARADAGHLQLQCERLRLDHAVADVVDLYAPAAGERGLSLRLESSREVWINGDGARIRQLFGNILDNSIKYIGDGKSIGVHVEAANGHAIVRVKDDGVGIAADDVGRVFDRFYRADKSRSRERNNGAGLGLAICQSIVKLHQGRIELRSTPNIGTEIIVSLPGAPSVALLQHAG